MSARKPFHVWMFEKFVEQGNKNGGMGWFVYWLMGLLVIAIFDVAVLQSTGSVYFFGYITLTITYLVWLGLRYLIAQYWLETDKEKEE